MWTTEEIEAMKTIEARLDQCEDSRFWHGLASGALELGDFVLIDGNVEEVK